MIPTGYRLATADDLTEGAEVLIPAKIDDDGDAAVDTGGYLAHVWSYMLPGLALVRDDAAPDEAVSAAECDRWRLRAEMADAGSRQLAAALHAALGIPEDRPITGDVIAEAVTHARDVADLRARAEKAEADLATAHRAIEEGPDDLDVSVMRRDLANATDAALRSALTTGSLSEAIRVAGVLCGIDAADPVAGLSALVERARGGR